MSNIVYNVYMKTCSKCKRELSRDSFHKNYKAPDGLNYYCKSCSRKHMVGWRKENAESIAKQAQKWREDNRESFLDYQRRWHKQNREKVLERQKKYRDDNKEYFSQWKRDNADKVRFYAKTRRLRMLDVQWSFYTTKEIYDRDRGICGICNAKVDFSIKAPNPLAPSVDHIRPVSKGGSDTFDNIQIAHLGCNLRKGATYEE